MAEKKSEEIKDHRGFWKKIGLVWLLTIYLMSGVLVAGLYGLNRVYADKIYPGVFLAGLDFSGKSWEAAADEVDRLIRGLEKTTVPIVVEGGQTFEPTLTELGVHFEKDAILADLFAIGHGANIWDGVVAATRSLIGSQDVPLATTFDQTVLTSYVDSTTEALARKPVDAQLKVENGTVEIVPGSPGEQADAAFLKTEILERLADVRFNQDLSSLPAIGLAITRAQPSIIEGNLESVRREAQSMIGETITMTFEDKTYAFTPTEIGSWLVFPTVEEQNRKTLRPEFDETKINASIASRVARPIDIKMVPKKILITTGQVTDEGRDGRTLDRPRLLAEIKRLLANRTRTPIQLVAADVPKTEQQVYPEFTLGLYEGRYLEVNLSNQTLYAMEGSTLISSFRVSTGKWGTPTPMGTRYIMNKIGNAYSRPFRLWMPLWNGLAQNPDGTGYEGYGIHELPCWDRNCRAREGISHLGTPVSHGCIRLGFGGPASFVYDWAPVGTPVYIHR